MLHEILFPLAAHGNVFRIATKSWAHALNCAAVVDAVPLSTSIPWDFFLSSRSWEFASHLGPTWGFWKNLGNYAQNGCYIPLTQHWIASQTPRMLVKISVLTGNMFPLWLKLKLKTNLYSAIKSGDSEALDGGTSQRGGQRRCGEIKMFWSGF